MNNNMTVNCAMRLTRNHWDKITSNCRQQLAFIPPRVLLQLKGRVKGWQVREEHNPNECPSIGWFWCWPLGSLASHCLHPLPAEWLTEGEMLFAALYFWKKLKNQSWVGKIVINSSHCAEVSPEMPVNWAGSGCWQREGQRNLACGSSCLKLLKTLSAFSWHFPGRAAAGGKEAEHVTAHVPLQNSTAPQH